jgi:hypothetical protein
LLFLTFPLLFKPAPPSPLGAVAFSTARRGGVLLNSKKKHKQLFCFKTKGNLMLSYFNLLRIK